ncbi:hypothetical protein FB451DRAFT_1122283 [Mycena latifolia]|nr:hypothetical protein FB451DRAFT_1122283 [Mycena latifolia]
MPNSERKYADRLYGPAGRYACWEPEIPRGLGDYGRIKRREWWQFWLKDGGFVMEGNIFENGMAERYKMPTPGNCGGDPGNGDRWIVSRDGAYRNVKVAGDFIPSTVTQCALKGAFEFTADESAFLVMHNEMTTAIDSPGRLRPLLQDPEMRGAVVVSEIHCCSAYIRGLTGKAGGTIEVGLSINPPGGGVGSVDAKAEWLHTATSGDIQSAVNPTGDRTYYPLFCLVSLEE